jgi:hypothetical protein
MSSTRVSALLFVLAGLAAMVVAASAGAMWVGAQAWLWLALIGGLAAAAGLTLGRPPARLDILPASSAELIDWLSTELGPAAAQHAQLFASFRALAHALYAEHELAAQAVEAADCDDTPAAHVVREQTLAALAYLCGDSEQGLTHAQAAQRIVHTVTQPFPERAEWLARFYVAWGEVLICRFHGELAVFEHFCADANPILAALSRAALARAALLLGKDREALEARVALAELAPSAHGVRDHADPSPGSRSGIRTALSESALPPAKQRAARR